MAVPQEVEVLILRSIAGDATAFEELVSRYHGRVHYFVRRLLGDLDRAEDVMQWVWLAVYQQLPRLRRTQAFVVWLYQIARNQANRELRRKLKDEASILPLDGISEDQLAEEPELPSEDAELVHEALARLGPEQREVLTLCYLEDLPYQEIAEIVGCSVGTVKSRIFYGKRVLLKEIEAMKR